MLVCPNQLRPRARPIVAGARWCSAHWCSPLSNGAQPVPTRAIHPGSVPSERGDVLRRAAGVRSTCEARDLPDNSAAEA